MQINSKKVWGKWRAVEVWLALLLAMFIVRLPGREKWLQRGPLRELTDVERTWLGMTKSLLAAIGRRHLKPASCLESALALKLIMRLRGIPANVRIGVQAPSTGFGAHAWIEPGDTAEERENFQPLSSIGHANAK